MRLQNKILAPEARRKKTETLSLRVDSNLRSALEEESRKTGVNLNTLVSQIFTRYVNWWRYETRLKLIPVSKDLLRELFGLAEREEIAETAKRLAESSGREHVLFLFQQINLGTVLQFIDVWSSHFDASQHRHDGKTHFYTVHHDVNINFSLFIKEYLSSMIQATVPRAVRFETVSPNSVSFSFEG